MPKKQFKMVGLLLGSFDPPHIGHIDAALQSINLVDEVWFIPAWQNPTSCRRFRHRAPWAAMPRDRGQHPRGSPHR